MDFNRIVWTAVISMALAVGSIIAGIRGDNLTLALGLSSIALATLSARERSRNLNREVWESPSVLRRRGCQN